MNTKFDEARTLSALTERPHHIKDPDTSDDYVAFAGYVLPIQAFSLIFIWSITNSQFYQQIWREQTDVIKTCRDLNPHDSELQTILDTSVGSHIHYKFRSALQHVEPNDIAELVNTMLEESYIVA